MKWKLEYCCFCGSLRTGALVIAYVTLVRDILIAALSILMLCLKSTPYAPFVDSVLILLFGSLLAIGIVNVIFTFVLLVGIHKYKSSYLKAYFIFNVLEMVVAVVAILSLCITSRLPGIIPWCLIFLAIHIYYLLIIRSYTMKMDDPSRKPAIFDTYSNPITSEFVVHFVPEEKGSAINYMYDAFD